MEKKNEAALRQIESDYKKACNARVKELAEARTQLIDRQNMTRHVEE